MSGTRAVDPAGNLRLIPIHQGLASALVWFPVMVLFTRSRFGLDGAVTLSSMYYLSVVVLEVPSGWMSDRFGRVLTLRVAAVCWILAQACFLLGHSSFALIAAGNVFLAGGFACLSGTDVTFHYDSLEAVGRAHQYRARQARVSAIGFVVTAVSALVGGVVGYGALRAVFAVALGLAVLQLAVTLALVEPGPADHGHPHGAPSPAGSAPPSVGMARVVDDLAAAMANLRARLLGWIFGYGVILVTLEHVAVAVLQPWLTELTDGTATEIGATPLLSGLVFSVVATVGAVAARSSDPLARRFGVVVTLLGLAVLSAVIVTAMALWVTPIVLVLVALRSVQGAAAPVLISQVVSSRVERRYRATLLSLNSLAGRLGWGLILLAVGRRVGDDVGRALQLLSIVAWSLVALAVVSAWLVVGPRRAEADQPTPLAP